MRNYKGAYLTLPLVALISGAGLFTVFPTRHAEACTPVPSEWQWTRPSLAENLETAEVVLVGTVTGARGPETYNRIATIEVERYLKGRGPETVEIVGYGSGGLCLSEVQVGGRYIFFAAGNPQEQMRAHYGPWRKPSGELGLRGQSNAIASPAEANISAATETAGTRVPLLRQTRSRRSLRLFHLPGEAPD